MSLVTEGGSTFLKRGALPSRSVSQPRLPAFSIQVQGTITTQRLPHRSDVSLGCCVEKLSSAQDWRDMPRILEITCPPDRTDDLVDRLENLDGAIGLSLQRGSSLQPPGDVLTVKVTNPAADDVLDAVGRLLDGRDDFSITASEPDYMISPPDFGVLDRETNEATWESVAAEFRKDANLEFNFIILMALAGIIAASGLWSDRLQIVIGAMVIAPGFVPLLRLPLGFLTGPRTMVSRGSAAVLSGYGALALSAAATFWALQTIDPSSSTELASREWIRYWSSFSPSAVIVALGAGTAGAVIVTAGRSILTAGVMIALALVPTMAITGMALAAGDFSLAAQAAGRWVVDAVSVVLAGGLVFAAKQALIHGRRGLG